MQVSFPILFKEKFPGFIIDGEHIVCEATRMSIRINEAFQLMVIHNYQFENILEDLNQRLW